MARRPGLKHLLADSGLDLSERGPVIILRNIKIILLLVGIALLAFMIHKIGLGNILHELKKLGFNVPIILIPYLAVYLVDAMGWRMTLPGRAGQIGFFRLFMTRMAGEAVNYVTPSAYLGGEPVKAYLLQKHGIPLVQGLASVVTAKTVMVLAQVFFILLGIGLAFASDPADQTIIYASAMILALVSVAAAILVFVQHRGMFFGMLRLCEMIGLPASFLKRREENLKDLDATILAFYNLNRPAFSFTFLFFLLGWLIGSLEILFLLYYLGLPVDLPTAISLEAIATVIRAAVFFIPSGIGAQEGGNVLLFVSYGYTPVTALTFSIVRRLREIIWIAVGLLYIAKQDIHVLEYGREAQRSSGAREGPSSRSARE